MTHKLRFFLVLVILGIIYAAIFQAVYPTEIGHGISSVVFLSLAAMIWGGLLLLIVLLVIGGLWEATR